MDDLVQADHALREAETQHRRWRQRIYAAETVGLLLISALLLAITLIRYWNHMNWSAR